MRRCGDDANAGVSSRTVRQQHLLSCSQPGQPSPSLGDACRQRKHSVEGPACSGRMCRRWWRGKWRRGGVDLFQVLVAVLTPSIARNTILVLPERGVPACCLTVRPLRLAPSTVSLCRQQRSRSSAAAASPCSAEPRQRPPPTRPPRPPPPPQARGHPARTSSPHPATATRERKGPTGDGGGGEGKQHQLLGTPQRAQADAASFLPAAAAAKEGTPTARGCQMRDDGHGSSAALLVDIRPAATVAAPWTRWQQRDSPGGRLPSPGRHLPSGDLPSQPWRRPVPGWAAGSKWGGAAEP